MFSELSSAIRRLFGNTSEVRYERFRDNLGNFEIFYPRGWRYDEEMAVVDGKYSISFASPDGLSTFNVAVDVQLPEGFDFEDYARKELESPESGIYTKMKKDRFREMPSFTREYSYASGGRRFFGGGVMFFSGKIVFSLSWSGPEKRKPGLAETFAHMLRTIVVREGFALPPSGLPGVAGTIGPAKRGRKRPRAS